MCKMERHINRVSFENNEPPEFLKKKTFFLSAIILLNYIILVPLVFLGIFTLFYDFIFGLGILLTSLFFLILNFSVDFLNNNARLLLILFSVLLLLLSLITYQLLIVCFSLLEIVILAFDYNTRHLFCN